MRCSLWVLAELPTPRALVAAAREMRAKGHTDLDAYSPYPVDGAPEVLGLDRSPVPLFCLVGAVAGVSLGFVFQSWANVLDYPIDVGGRPLFAVPMFVPITFELGILFASFGAFFGLIAYLRLPRLHHPVFEVEGFESASVDAFWLGVRARDADEAGRIVTQLATYAPLRITRVEAEA